MQPLGFLLVPPGFDDDPGDLTEGITDASVGIFGALERDQAGATDGLPPARSQRGRSAAPTAAAGGAGPEADDTDPLKATGLQRI